MDTGISRRMGIYGLSPAEQRVAWLVLAGMTNKQIAHSMGRSAETVKHHVSNMRVKLDLTCSFPSMDSRADRAELVEALNSDEWAAHAAAGRTDKEVAW